MIKKLLQLTMICLLFAACGKEEPSAPVEPPVPAELQLKKADFRDLKNFSKDKVEEAYHAFELSCEAIAGQSGDYLGGAAIKVPTADYQALCDKLKKTAPKNFRRFLQENFTPYLVTYQGSSEGKFTSYYETAINASYGKSERYRFPIYGKPTDLIEFNPQDFDPQLPSKRLLGRVEGQKLVPYFSRQEIMQRGIEAPVILWADSYVDIFDMQTQGSAVANLEDGSKVRIGFADTNGREFKGIGRILLDHKQLKPGEASMGNIKRWLKENPELAQRYMNENRRYVFHRLVNAEGPIGAQGVPLTAGRSLAVDKRFIPLGMPLWLETRGPHREKIEKLVIAQDIGGAIKGAVRGDYFWGSGGEEILDLAGKMNAAGRYFILLPKKTEQVKP